jgi:hypothetical protein
MLWLAAKLGKVSTTAIRSIDRSILLVRNGCVLDFLEKWLRLARCDGSIEIYHFGLLAGLLVCKIKLAHTSGSSATLCMCTFTQ